MAALGDLDGAVEDLGAGHEHHSRADGHEPSRAGPAEVDGECADQAADEGCGEGLGDRRRPPRQRAPARPAAAKPAPAKGMCREWHTGVSRPPATRQASREEVGAFQCHHVSATQCAACASPPARNAQPKVLIGMEKYTG